MIVLQVLKEKQALAALKIQVCSSQLCTVQPHWFCCEASACDQWDLQQNVQVLCQIYLGAG